MSIQEQLIAPIEAILRQEQRFTLGICGAPGAGKSTLADWIVREWNRLHPDEAVLVPMDGYHHSNEDLVRMGLLPLKGIPDTFDAEAFVEKLRQLRVKPAESHYFPRFDRSIEASIENAIVVKPLQRLIVVEGNYLLLPDPPWEEIKPLLDECWFIEADESLLLPRLQSRHEAGGKTFADARAKVESTDLPNARLVTESSQRADKILPAVELIKLLEETMSTER